MTLAGTGDVVAITAELDEVTRENQALRHTVNQHADEIAQLREQLRLANIDAFTAATEVDALEADLTVATEEAVAARHAGRQLVAELRGICDAADQQPAMRCLAALRVELNQRFPWDEAGE